MHRLALCLPPAPLRPSPTAPDHLAILLIIMIDARRLPPRRPHPDAPSPN